MALVKYNNRSILNVTALDSIASGDMNLITTNTISSGVSSSSFTSSIDSTYDTYLFKFINMHPATDDQKFTFNLSIDGGSNYNVTKTTSASRAYHTEDDSATSLSYRTGDDLAQSTSYQGLTGSVGNDNDQSCSGELFLFSPSNTTFVKHFIANAAVITNGNYNYNWHSAGYCNVTAAIDGVQFSFSSGNIDSGTIKMYGVV
jgi:uncharacterized lipoprotein